jgi:hypothetical protein
MRRTCCSSTAGFFKRPSAATFISCSSGDVLHRKNDNRDARSISLMR